MVNLEFYRKRKTKYPPIHKFSQLDWWQIVLVIIAAVLLEPLVPTRRLVMFRLRVAITLSK